MNLTRRRATSLLTSFLSVTLITTAFVLPAPAQAKDKITWYVTNWSPFYLTRGKHKRQGINDKLIKYVHQHLPDYDIQWKNMTAKMVPEAMEKGQKPVPVRPVQDTRARKVCLLFQIPFHH